MRITLVQLDASPGRPDVNLVAGIDAMADAGAAGADLVVFPELWQIRYTGCPVESEGRDAWLRFAITDDDPWLVRFRETAATTGTAAVITYLRQTEAGPTNAAAVVDADGELVFVHDKVHLCDFSWEAVLTSGEEFRTGAVRTRAGTVQLGVMTCFDREFPESARVLALSGAELIVCPNACLLCDDRIGQLRARAFENMTAVAMANYPLPFMNGRSSAFDGISTQGDRPRDHGLVVAGPRPGLVHADLDLDWLRRYRAEGLWTAERRRPAAYRKLVAPAGMRGGAP